MERGHLAQRVLAHGAVVEGVADVGSDDDLVGEQVADQLQLLRAVVH